MRRRGHGEAGQAAVEYVAAVAIATTILLGVTGVLSRELDPPRTPPPFVAAAAQPLENHDEYPSRFNPLYRLHGMPSLEGRDGEPIGAFLKKVGREAAMNARQRAAFAEAFMRGLGDQVVFRGTMFLRDPLAQFLPELGPAFVLKLALKIVPHAKLSYELSGYVIDVVRHYDEPPTELAYRLGQRAGDDIFEVLLSKGRARAKVARDRALGGPPPASLQRPVTPGEAPTGAPARRTDARPGPAF